MVEPQEESKVEMDVVEALALYESGELDIVADADALLVFTGTLEQMELSEMSSAP
jgi:hypothetical protein